MGLVSCLPVKVAVASCASSRARSTTLSRASFRSERTMNADTTKPMANRNDRIAHSDRRLRRTADPNIDPSETLRRLATV
jgi:hypothetical protein